MKLAEILEKEHARADLQQCAVIHLVLEGTFYHAYEWSAWLCFRYVAQLKATRRLLQKDSQETLVFVGFPQNSLTKYTPAGAETVQQEDGSLDFVLPLSVFESDSTFESLQNDFEHWKQSVALTEKSQKKVKEEKYGLLPSERPARLTDIMREIMAYPLEQRSPMDSMVFLAEVKQKLATIL